MWAYSKEPGGCSAADVTMSAMLATNARITARRLPNQTIGVSRKVGHQSHPQRRESVEQKSQQRYLLLQLVHQDAQHSEREEVVVLFTLLKAQAFQALAETSVAPTLYVMDSRRSV